MIANSSEILGNLNGERTYLIILIHLDYIGTGM